MSSTTNNPSRPNVAPTEQPSRSMVSEETRARWRTMLTAQITSGREYDLGSLVESVVARICDEQSLTISASAKGMTAVDSVMEAVSAELEKAKAVIAGQGPETLKVPFAGFKIDRIETAQAPARRGLPNSTMVRSHVQKFHKATPLESLIYTRKMLTTHIDRTANQFEQLKTERTALDQKMRRSLDERTRIVSNLALVSKELYGLAKEVVATLPAEALRTKPAVARVPASTNKTPAAQSNAAQTTQVLPTTAPRAAQARTAVHGARAKPAPVPGKGTPVAPPKT